MSANASRRDFFGKLAVGAATLGLTSISPTLSLYAGSPSNATENDPETWFKQIKGKHRMVFDATEPHDILPFAWPKVFLMTNAATGTPEKENSAVVVLRHSAIGYAMNDDLWAKYKLGELFQANDHKTGKPATRNPFWKPAAGDFQVPGLGAVAIGINELQDSGVMFCVCNVALTVYSAVAAQQTNQDAAAVKKEWENGLLPGIQVVPSGVWAVGRAQERGCAYCFAG